MDMMKFQALALRTESPPNDETIKRLVRTYPMYSEQLEEIVHLGGFLDHLKKYIFYRRQDGTVEDQLPPVWPTGEKRERIEQMARILHGLIGIITEAGELAEEVVNYIEGKKSELDTDHISEEVFDGCLWYGNLILSAINKTIPQVAEQGIAKLQVRFPHKFTEEAAEHRDTTAEMTRFQEAGKTAP